MNIVIKPESPAVNCCFTNVKLPFPKSFVPSFLTIGPASETANASAPSVK